MVSPIKIMRVRVTAKGLSEGLVRWLTLDTAGRPVEEGTSAPAALRTIADIELVVPATQVAQHVLELPAVAARHEAAVIRQMLEDRILGGMEDCHWAVGERSGNHAVVWVVSRNWMLALLDACRAARLFPVRIIPEQALLPVQSCAVTTDGFIYRTGSGTCGSLPDETLLGVVCNEQLTRIERLLAAPLASPVDLQQGLPALRQASSRLSRPLLKALGVLVLGIALLHLVSLILVWRQLAGQEGRLHEAIRQSFAAAHPGVPIVDPILQWRQLHGKQNSSGDMLDQVAQIASLGAQNIRPQRIDAEGSSIRITLGASDSARLKKVLQEKRFPIETQTTDKGLEQIIISRRTPGGRP